MAERLSNVSRSRGIAIAVVLATLLIALYATRLAFAPVYLIHDEINFSLQAASIADSGRDLNGRLLPVYFSEPEFTAGRDPLMIYATALALKVLPLSESAVRLPTALLGVVNVLLLAWLARLLLGDSRLAIAAGALLALSPGHFIHSRLALSVLYPLPFVILWLIALCKVDEGAGRRSVLASGALLGLGIYAYLASVVMMPLYLLLTAVLLAERRRFAALRWAMFGFAIVLIPIVLWSVAHPERYGDLLRAYRPGEITAQSTVIDASDAITPGDWRSRLSEWWLYFDPTYLFLSGDSSLTNSTRRAGLFPLAVAVFLPVGIWRVARRRGVDRVIAIGFVTAPLAVVLTGVLHLHRYRGLFVLPFGVLLATYGLQAFLASPKRAWRLVGVLLLAAVPLQFWDFYRDYMGAYRVASSEWYGGNLRGALVEVMQHPPASGQAYVSRTIPYADVYWRFYSQTVAGAPAAATPIDLELASAQWFAPGSKAVVAIDEPLAGVLDRTGWRRELIVTEPDGTPAFVVFGRP